MAYIDDPLKKKQPGMLGQPIGQTVPQGATLRSGPAMAAPKRAAGPTSGAGWVNLQDYLGLNQQQGQADAAKLTAGVNALGAQAQGLVKGVEDKFTTGMGTD